MHYNDDVSDLVNQAESLLNPDEPVLFGPRSLPVNSNTLIEDIVEHIEAIRIPKLEAMSDELNQQAKRIIDDEELHQQALDIQIDLETRIYHLEELAMELVQRAEQDDSDDEDSDDDDEEGPRVGEKGAPAGYEELWATEFLAGGL